MFLNVNCTSSWSKQPTTATTNDDAAATTTTSTAAPDPTEATGDNGRQLACQHDAGATSASAVSVKLLLLVVGSKRKQYQDLTGYKC